MTPLFAALALLIGSVSPGGVQPVGLFADGSDVIYGITAFGGIPSGPNDSIGNGVIYRVNQDGSGYTVLHALSWNEGAHPNQILQGARGRLIVQTPSGGSTGRGTVFQVDETGAGFRLLYSFKGFGNHALAVGDADTVYVSDRDGGNADVVLAISNGSARELATFPTQVRVAGIALHRNAVYALLANDQECSWSVARIGPDGARIVAARSTTHYGTQCPDGVLYHIAATTTGEIYVSEPYGVYHIGTHGAELAFSAKPVPSDAAEWPSFATVSDLEPGANRNVLAFVSAVPFANSGTIYSIRPGANARVEYIFPSDVARSFERTDYGQAVSLTQTAGGEIVGAFFGKGECGTNGAPDPPTACGWMFSLKRGAFSAIYTFGAPPPQQTRAGLQQSNIATGFYPTGLPGEFLLDRRTGPFLPFAAETPQPIDISVKSEDTGQSVALQFKGATTAWANTPIVTRVPALRYVAPPLNSGMYDVVAAGLQGRRFYVPAVVPKMPPLRMGERFLALQDAAGGWPALLDSNGHSLGVSPVTLRAFLHGRFRLTAGDGRVVEFSANYHTPVEIRGLVPITDDERDETIRRYSGKLVYPMYFSATCVQRDGEYRDVPIGEGPVRLRTVYRTYGYSRTLSIQARTGFASFASVDPLVLVFDADRSRCLGLYALAADTWQLQHMISPTPLVDARWAAHYRDAIRRRAVLTGMSRDMVVAALGYPPIYASTAALRKLDSWDYAGDFEQSSPVVHFSEDRVTSCDGSC